MVHIIALEGILYRIDYATFVMNHFLKLDSHNYTAELCCFAYITIALKKDLKISTKKLANCELETVVLIVVYASSGPLISKFEPKYTKKTFAVIWRVNIIKNYDVMHAFVKQGKSIHYARPFFNIYGLKIKK